MVIEGSFLFRLGDEEVLLSTGDYVRIPNNTPDKIVEVKENTTILGVRYPSKPDNKTLLE